MGTNERKRSADMRSEPQTPRRRWGRAFLWLGTVAALVIVALVVSFTAEDNRDAIDDEPFDTDVFCLTASRFRDFDELNLDTGAGPDQLRSLQTVAQQLATLSPEPIAEDLDAVREALQNVEGVVRAIPPDEPDALAIVTDTLDQELAAVAGQTETVANYIERWCGPLGSLPPTSVTTPDMETSVPTAPG